MKVSLLLLAFSLLPLSTTRADDDAPAEMPADWNEDYRIRDENRCLQKNDLEACGQVFFRREGAAAEEIFAKIVKFCIDGDDKACHWWAGELHDRGEHQEALLIFHGTPTKPRDGTYGLLEYKHGDRKVAYDFVARECRTDWSRCAFWVRYIPDHPRIDELLLYTDLACSLLETRASGATSCTLRATYFLTERWDPAKAIADLSLSCDLGNALGCHLLAAHPWANVFVALEGFCAAMDRGSLRSIRDIAERDRLCGTKPGWPELNSYRRLGENHFAGFSAEQQRAPASIAGD